jgi:hypothetical protein
MIEFGSPVGKLPSDDSGIIISLHFSSVKSPLWLNSKAPFVSPALISWTFIPLHTLIKSDLKTANKINQRIKHQQNALTLFIIPKIFL